MWRRVGGRSPSTGAPRAAALLLRLTKQLYPQTRVWTLLGLGAVPAARLSRADGKGGIAGISRFFPVSPIRKRTPPTSEFPGASRRRISIGCRFRYPCSYSELTGLVMTLPDGEIMYH